MLIQIFFPWAVSVILTTTVALVLEPDDSDYSPEPALQMPDEEGGC